MSDVIYFRRPELDSCNLETIKAQCQQSWFSSQTMPTEVVEALVGEVMQLRKEAEKAVGLQLRLGAAELRATEWEEAWMHCSRIRDKSGQTIMRLQKHLVILHRELVQAKLDAEIYETMYDTRHTERNACIVKSRARLASIREAIDWLWGFYDGTLVAKSGFEDDIQDAWIKLLMSVDTRET